MGLFGKKKEEEPEILGFGFPAAEKRKEVEGVTSLAPPPPPEEPITAAPPTAPTAPIEPAAPKPGLKPEPITPTAPEPMQAAPQPKAAEGLPSLERRPIMPMTMPEEIEAPRAPSIQRLRPHVFLKISKYKEVMSSIDKVMSHIKDLKKTLSNIKDVEEKEAIKIKESEALLLKLEEVAGVFDKIFSSPEK